MKLLLSISLLLSCCVVLHAQSDIDDSTARLEMARVLRDGGKLAEAEAAYRQVLESKPKDVAAAQELVEVLVWAKKNSEAEAILVAIPEEEWTPTGLSAAADLDIQAGRFEIAEARLRKLQNQAPSDASALRLASVLSWRKAYPESLELFQALVEKNPSDVQLRRKYAQVLGWAGQQEQAAEQWKLSLSPTP
jgi:thioredoxin-like negative regulator of GroEL